MDTTITERLYELQPETSGALSKVQTEAWDSADAALLELCRRRLANMLGDKQATEGEAEHGVDEEKLAAVDNWDTSPLFTAAEQAHLAFTEQFVVAVSSVSDDDVNALLEHREPAEVYDFINALYVIDMTQRLKMVAAATIGESK